MKNYYELTQKLGMENVSFNTKAGVCEIMSLFQKAVTEHTLEMGVDFESIRKKHGAKWFIVSARLEFNGFPSLFDTVKITTWPQKTGAFKFPRVFTLETQNGASLANAITQWCVVDFESGELLKADTIALPFSEFIESNPVASKSIIPICKNPELAYSRKMLVSDLDLNGHVNNVSYIKIALDSFCSKELDKMNIKAFDIQYKKQCFEGDTLFVYKEKCENGFVIEGKTEADLIFRAKLETQI